MNTIRLFIYAIVMLVTSCISIDVSSVVTNPDIFDVIEEGKVKLYIHEKSPEFTKLGYVQVLVYEAYADDIGNITNAARIEASKMGADCLVLTDLQSLNDKESKLIISGEVQASISTSSYYPTQYIFIAGKEL